MREHLQRTVRECLLMVVEPLYHKVKRSVASRFWWNNSNKFQTVTLWRETQRVSLRAFLRTLLSNPQIANTNAIQEFLSLSHITPTDADVIDIERRRAMDEKRVQEQQKFYEIAQKRAAELDVYMEQ